MATGLDLGVKGVKAVSSNFRSRSRNISRGRSLSRGLSRGRSLSRGLSRGRSLARGRNASGGIRTRRRRRH
jgi:transposase